MLTHVDFASRYKIAKAPMNKEESGVAFLLEAVYKKCGASKFPKVFQCDNGSVFKCDVTKLLKKYNVDIQRTTTKCKHAHTAFVADFNKGLTTETVVSVHECTRDSGPWRCFDGLP